MDRLSKPRVFLSHSKEDVLFIERLHEDLRKCQIDPWLDSEDIRHGKPWLEAIFQDGIPTCDAVLVYLTPPSIESAMVKKELDAAILQQLQDKRVAFLPYVSEAATRSSLRADIRALQVLVWNEGNYEAMLPRAVAEIWRSFMERSVHAAVQEERLGRLEAELELTRLKQEEQSTVFTPAEDAEFSHIWRSLDRIDYVEIREQAIEQDGDGQSVTRELAAFRVGIHLGSLVALLVRAGYEYSSWDVRPYLSERLGAHLCEHGLGAPGSHFEVTKTPDIVDELMMYGLLQRIYEPPLPQKAPWDRMPAFNRPTYRHVWSPKSFRLRYWLAFHDCLPDQLEVSSVDTEVGA